MRVDPASPGEAAPDEDPPQRKFLPSDHHGGADVQVPKRVQARDASVLGLSGHIPKIGALRRKDEQHEVKDPY